MAVTDALRAAASRALKTQEAADAARAELYNVIREGLESGELKVRDVIAETGLSRQRVYQIRHLPH